MSKSAYSKKIVLKVLTVILLALVAGIIVGLLKKQPGEPPQDISATISGLANVPVSSLFGQIISVNANELGLAVSEVLGVALENNSALRNRKVILNTDTLIYERVAKDSSQYQKEVEQYQKTNPESYRIPPSRFTTRYLTKSDLKVGDVIMVREANFPDLKYKTEIQASEILRSHL